jgi:transcriptional regulator with XRE-family HTH domain
MVRSQGAADLESWEDAAKLSVDEAARRCGIDSRYYSKIKKGLRRPGRVVALRIRAAAGVAVEAWDFPATSPAHGERAS